MSDFQFYSTNEPLLNEIVLIQCIEKKDAYFKSKLIEYELYDGILNFQDATRKKKIKCWNNIISLNKDIIAKIEDIDNVKKIAKLSLISFKNDNYDNYFNENKIMLKFVKTFCIQNNYNFITIWNDIIHKIDIMRRANENADSISIWNYFINNSHPEDNLLNSIYYNQLVELYNNKYLNNNEKVITKFGIISNIGIDIIKTIFKQILSNINYDFTLKYDSTPFYLFETKLSNIDNDLIHNMFINDLNCEIKKYNILQQNIFIKIQFIAKKNV